MVGENYRERVFAIYRKYAPERLGTVEATLVKFKGSEVALIDALIKKYGPEPADDPSVASEGLPAPQQAQPASPESAHQAYRDRLFAMYRKYAPEKLDSVDDMLARYKGKEELLMEALTKKYGPEPPKEGQLQQEHDQSAGKAESKSGLVITGVVPQDKWLSPASAKTCQFQDCGKAFGMFGSKGNCHRCGIVVCSSCRQTTVIPGHYDDQPKPCCPKCFENIEKQKKKWHSNVASTTTTTPTTPLPDAATPFEKFVATLIISRKEKEELNRLLLEEVAVVAERTTTNFQHQLTALQRETQAYKAAQASDALGAASVSLSAEMRKELERRVESARSMMEETFALKLAEVEEPLRDEVDRYKRLYEESKRSTDEHLQEQRAALALSYETEIAEIRRSAVEVQEKLKQNHLVIKNSYQAQKEQLHQENEVLEQHNRMLSRQVQLLGAVPVKVGESLREDGAAANNSAEQLRALTLERDELRSSLANTKELLTKATRENSALEEELQQVHEVLKETKTGAAELQKRLEAEIANLKAQLTAKHVDPEAASPPSSPRSQVPLGVDCFALRELQDVRPLGAGGFGSVMLVRTVASNRLLAMKVPLSFEQLLALRGGSSLTELSKEALRCAVRDYQIASRLRHPHIVPFAGLVGSMEQPIGMLMEYVDGGSLFDAIVQSGRKPSLSEFLRIAVDLTSAVAHLHAHKVWHRDIKPHNVLIGSNGHIYLADFGTASRGDVISDVTAGCATTTSAGVPQSLKYLDPQQNRQGPGDVYALGLSLLEVYLGKPLSTAQEAPRLVSREVHPVLRGLFHHLVVDSDANDRDTAAVLFEKLSRLRSTYAPHATVDSAWAEELPNNWLSLGCSATIYAVQHLSPMLADRIPVAQLCSAVSPDGAGALIRALPAEPPKSASTITDLSKPANLPSGVVLLVRNAVLEGSFEARMRLLRSRSTAYYDANGSACTSWKDDTLVDGSKTQHHTQEVLGHRDAVMARLNDRVWKPFAANVDGDLVRVALLFHATTIEAALQIADAGFMSYARLDAGYFGKGLYFTPDFAYARDVYAADMLCDGKKVAIIAAYVCMRHVFPCVDMSMMGKSNRGGYDAHAAVVVQKSPQNAMVYQPVTKGEWKTYWNGLTSYVEVVVFDCAQALPAALVIL